MEIDNSLLAEARNFLRPPTPPVRSVSEVLREPLRTLVSTSGKVVADEAPHMVPYMGREAPIRTIKIKQDDSTVDVALWRDHCTHTLKAGDYITVKSAVLSEYNRQKQLSTNTRTKIEISAPPLQNINVTILGLQRTAEDFEVLCQLSGDEIQTFSCPPTVLQEMLPKDDENADLVDLVSSVIPGIVDITIQTNTIVSANTKISSLKL